MKEHKYEKKTKKKKNAKIAKKNIFYLLLQQQQQQQQPSAARSLYANEEGRVRYVLCSALLCFLKASFGVGCRTRGRIEISAGTIGFRGRAERGGGGKGLGNVSIGGGIRMEWGGLWFARGGGVTDGGGGESLSLSFSFLFSFLLFIFFALRATQNKGELQKGE